jgi:hypothetical protein
VCIGLTSNGGRSKGVSVFLFDLTVADAGAAANDEAAAVSTAPSPTPAFSSPSPSITEQILYKLNDDHLPICNSSHARRGLIVFEASGVLSKGVVKQSRAAGMMEKVYGGGDEAGDCGGVSSNAESSAGIDLIYRLIRRPLELWTRPT